MGSSLSPMVCFILPLSLPLTCVRSVSAAVAPTMVAAATMSARPTHGASWQPTGARQSVRAARRQVDTKELAEGPETATARTGIGDARARALGAAHVDGADETAWERETTEEVEAETRKRQRAEDEKEERKAKKQRQKAAVEEDKARREAAGQGASGETKNAAREVARSEAAREAQVRSLKEGSKRRRKEAKARQREAGEAAGSGAAEGER